MTTMTASRGNLQSALATVSRALPARPALPVLACVHIVATGREAVITASDFDLTIATRLTIEGDDMDIAVSGARLRDLVSKFTGSTVTFELVDTSTLLVACDRAKYRLQAIDVEDFPPTPELPPQVGTTTSGRLALASSAVGHAATDDPSLGNISGLAMKAVDGTLALVATDRFRIAACPTPWDGNDFTARASKAGIAGISKALKGDITIHEGGGLLGFRDAFTTTIIRQLTGDMIPWEKFVDLTHPIEHAFTKSDLTEAVDRARVVAEDHTILRLELTANSLTLTSDGSDQAHEHVECEGNGESDFWVNGQYLAELLASIPEDRIRIWTLPTAGFPVVVRPEPEGDSVTSAATHVLMTRRKTS